MDTISALQNRFLVGTKRFARMAYLLGRYKGDTDPRHLFVGKDLAGGRLALPWFQSVYQRTDRDGCSEQLWLVRPCSRTWDPAEAQLRFEMLAYEAGKIIKEMADFFPEIERQILQLRGPTEAWILSLFELRPHRQMSELEVRYALAGEETPMTGAFPGLFREERGTYFSLLTDVFLESVVACAILLERLDVPAAKRNQATSA